MVISRMHYEIKVGYNKLNSNHKPDLLPAQIDDVINKASDDYVEIFYSGNNSKEYKLGFEVTQQRVDMLSTLVVPEKSISPTLVRTNVYKASTTLTPSYRHFLRGWVIATGCPQQIPITIVRHNDLDKMLLDSNQKPSLKWKRCLGTFKQDGLYLYTDYVITSVVIEYLSNPVKVYSGGYDSLEYLQGDLTAPNTGDPIVNSNLPEQHHYILVDMAIQHLARVLEDGQKLNLQKEGLLSKI